LLTALLVLAIVASSALVFTNRVELLKLAVIIALWAAVLAAFVSFIYRRQSDMDQAKARDLKLVYDLQLDREISARREYELSVESQLRRELTSELHAQASDEVASLRAELAALRANLEILFDTDLQHRPAIETERTSVHTFPDWSTPETVGGQERGDRGSGLGRVISSRIDTEDRDDTDPNTEESPIIDVPVEPSPPEQEWGPPVDPGGAHRRASEAESARRGWQPQPSPAPRPAPEPPPFAHEPAVRFPWPPPEPSPQPTPAPQPQPEPAARSQWREPEQPARHTPSGDPEWRPAPAEGQFIPAGSPGSNWTSPVTENGSSAHPPTRAPEPTTPPEPAMAPAPAPQPAPAPEPATTPPAAEPPRGRHATAAQAAEETARRARHSAPADADPGRRPAPPTLATSPPPPPTPTPPTPQPPAPQPRSEPAARHRGADEPDSAAGQHIGGQPLSELLARLQVTSTEGGRRRRREE
jgi:hypothetical protein